MTALDRILAECERVESRHEMRGEMFKWCNACSDERWKAPHPCDAVKLARALREALGIFLAEGFPLYSHEEERIASHLGLAGPSAIPPEESKEQGSTETKVTS